MSLLFATPQRAKAGRSLKFLALGFYKEAAPPALWNIPTGLRHSAQRCRDAGTATLGNGAENESTLKDLQPMAAGYNSVGVEICFGR
jgi:hypothetical protein